MAGSDASAPEQVARKIIVSAATVACGECGRMRKPANLHWSPATGRYLCYSCISGRLRGPTLRETLQRITKPASGSAAS